MTPPTNVTRTSEPHCKRRRPIGFSISSSLEDDCVWAIWASIKGGDESHFSATSICHDFPSRSRSERGGVVRRCWFHGDDILLLPLVGCLWKRLSPKPPSSPAMQHRTNAQLFAAYPLAPLAASFGLGILGALLFGIPLRPVVSIAALTTLLAVIALLGREMKLATAFVILTMLFVDPL